MPNNFTTPNFNIDTSIDQAGLVTLKGAPLAAGDKYYVYNNAVVTFNADVPLLIISLGQTSAGAAPTDQKVGHVVFDASGGSFTVTFDGNASLILSGVISNPASPAAESKNNSITFITDATHTVTFTNSIGAYSSSYVHILYMLYGEWINADYFVLQYHYVSGGLWLPSPGNTNAILHEFGHLTSRPGDVQSVLCGWSGAMNVDCDFGFVTVDAQDFTGNRAWSLVNAVTVADNTEIAVRGIQAANVPASRRCGIVGIYVLNGTTGSEIIKSEQRVGTAVGWVTEIVPTTPSAVDPATGGDLQFTWANGASYRDEDDGDARTDWMYIYQSGDGYVDPVAVGKAKDGSVIAGGFTDNVMVTFKMRASTDGYFFSAFTSTFTGTPTGPSATTIATTIPGQRRIGDIQSLGTYGCWVTGPVVESPVGSSIVKGDE